MTKMRCFFCENALELSNFISEPSALDLVFVYHKWKVVITDLRNFETNIDFWTLISQQYRFSMESML